MGVNVAKVILDSPVPHLDHVFDYRIPNHLQTLVVPGVRIRVPFRKRRVDGFVLAISDSTEVAGKLIDVETLISPEIVLTREISQLCQMVAHRKVGNLYDVIRAAVPPRHARAEKRLMDQSPRNDFDLTVRDSLEQIHLIDFLEDETSAKVAVVDIGLAESFVTIVSRLLQNNLSNAIILLPDQYDVSVLLESISNPNLRSRVAVLTSQQSSEQRYTEFLKVLRGVSDLVIGTRSAVFAPLRNLKSIIMLDDGDDLYLSPQAPYWSGSEVAMYRSELEGCKVVLASRVKSIESIDLIKSGRAIQIPSDSQKLNQRISIADDTNDPGTKSGFQGRLPSSVFNAIREGVNKGTVLISVPRKGYLPVVACAKCRELFKCQKCSGSISFNQPGSSGECSRCGMLVGQPKCRKCGGGKTRSLVRGIERTAEEIGKAFPGNNIVYLHGDNRESVIAGDSRIVIAMPGTEPLQSFSTVIVLDSHLSLTRPEGNSQIRYLRHLLRLRSMLEESGEMIVVGETDNQVLQAFLRADASRVSEALLQERISAKLSPYARTAKLFGDWSALIEVKNLMPPHAQIWGPIKNPNLQSEKHEASILISVPKFESEDLVSSLRSWVVTRSANRQSAVAVRIDPDDL